MSKVSISDGSHARLEDIIDDLTASYSCGRPVDNLESAALPSSRQVVAALEDLMHATYMGFYSTVDLSEVNLRQYIGAHLYRAHDVLVEQISRAVVYRRKGGGEPEQQDVEWSEKAVLAALARLPALRAMLALDVQAAFDGDPAAKSIEEIVFSYPALEAITGYRIAHEFFLQEVPLIPRIMTEHVHSRTGIDIHPGATIGESFFIDHGTGVVIGETTTIGDRVKLYQGVTLGAVSIPRDQCGELIRNGKRHPTLEDDVTVYAGATILGGETVVGARSTIGGNVWLTESVPADSRITYSLPVECQAEKTTD